MVNGKQEILAESTTLTEFLKSKGFNAKVVVVEYNQKIAANADWDKIILQDGDTLEIVSFVGGG
jgi:sulfur carrier protein